MPTVRSLAKTRRLAEKLLFPPPRRTHHLHEALAEIPQFWVVLELPWYRDGRTQQIWARRVEGERLYFFNPGAEDPAGPALLKRRREPDGGESARLTDLERLFARGGEALIL